MNSPTLRNHILFAAVLIYFSITFHGVLFTTNGVLERDGFYHSRYAQMLPERGLSRSFPWMQFTDWKDHFADKDFLYHVILAPFCRNAAEPLPGAKWATLLLEILAFTAFYVALVRLNVRWPVFWAILLIIGSGLFLNRLLMVRSHVFSILLMILSAWAIVRDKPKLCVALGFLYAWSYSFPLAMAITAVAASAGRWLFAERSWQPWKVAGASTLGVSAGLIIHPYSPNTLTLIWTLLKITTSRAAGVQLELGSEFQPMLSSRDFTSLSAFGRGLLSLILAVPGPLLALIAAIVLVALLRSGRLRGRTLSAESVAAVSAALAWFAAIFVFSRLVEYFAPLATLAAALVCRDAFSDSAEQPKSRTPRAIVGALAGVVLLAGLAWLSLDEVTELVHSTLPHHSSQMYISEAQWRGGRFFSNELNGGAAEWMRQHIPIGSTVINFHWDDFTELYYVAPEFHYIVGLDPTLMRVAYPEQSATLEAMRTKKTPLDFHKLHELFHSNYLIMRNTRAAEFPELKHGIIAPVYVEEGAAIYKLN